MSVVQLRDNLYSVGVINPTLRVFDIIMEAEYGTTYNSYLITDEKNVLIDLVHESFCDEYIANIEQIVPISKIDYIIMNHNEPDHSGSLQKILKMNPDIVVIASMGGMRFLKNLVNFDFHEQIVKEGEKLNVGTTELEFLMAPNLHWPDTMFTYYPKEKTIFTCDFLGAHYCESHLYENQIIYKDKYEAAFRHYFDCIMSPFKPFVLAGLAKMQPLDLEMCCTSHGPILTDSLSKSMDLYCEWSVPTQKVGKPRVAIVYASAYGYTRELAEAAFDELSQEYDVELFDVVDDSLEKIVECAHDADAILIGSCTINRDAVPPIWRVITSLDAIAMSGRPVGVFGSYGWTGEARGMIADRMKSLKCKVIGEPFGVVFRPTEDDFKQMKQYAREVVAAIK